MASKNFLLVSLEESKAKELAQVVSNDLCRRMLDFLASRKSATETEVAKELGIPLSTAHYNLKLLLKSGIVKAEEYHYSEKGREVNHYSLVNRYIIIAPKETATESLASKLRKILPVALAAVGTGLVIQALSSMKQGIGRASYIQPVIGRAADASAAAEEVVERAASETAVAESAGIVQTMQSRPEIALWFASGALFALAVYFAYDYILTKLRRKE